MSPKEVLRSWPRWTGPAAMIFSALYGTLGLLWTLGLPGFPFGEGDVPDARAESLLGDTTAAGAAPVIAGLGLGGVVLAVVLLRTSSRVATVLGWLYAVGLIALVNDFRVLLALAYAPIGIICAPFGWPPLDYFEKALPWPVVNMLICQLGGLLWLGATLAQQRRSRGACGACGRNPARPAGWTSPAAAAKWGRVAAYTAAAIPFFYAAIRWAWAFHIPFGLPAAHLAELHASGLVWAGVYLASFAALGGILTLGLVRPWGEVWPRWVLGRAGKPVPRAFPITFASVVTAALLPTLGSVLLVVDWSKPSGWLTQPMSYWPLWAVCLGTATLGYHYRTRAACRSCGVGEQLGQPGRVRA